MATEDDMVTLECEDGQQCQVKYKHISMCETIKNLVEDAGTEAPIPNPRVSSKTMEYVIVYCIYHVDNPAPVAPAEGGGGGENKTVKLSDWDSQFVDQLDQKQLGELIKAANYLDNKKLLDLLCKYGVAERIKNFTTDQICAYFGITDRLTPEQEEQIRRENMWVEEN